MRVVIHGDTGSVLFRSAVPLLAVSCRRCPHRVLLRAEQLEAHEHDRRELWRLPLICRCGTKDVQRFLLESPDEQAAFLAGATHSKVRPRDEATRSGLIPLLMRWRRAVGPLGSSAGTASAVCWFALRRSKRDAATDANSARPLCAVPGVAPAISSQACLVLAPRRSTSRGTIDGPP